MIVDASNRNPSILNGGLGKISPLYWVSVLAMAAAIDLKQNELASSGSPDYKFPGDLGWDPLGLYPSDPEGQRRMQTAEIKHGTCSTPIIVVGTQSLFVTETNTS